MPETVALKRRTGVELIKTGRWAISTGTWTPTPDDLAAAVEAARCPAVRNPIIKLGHTDSRFDGEPALGWFENLRLTDGGHTLVADQVTLPWLHDVQAAAYPDRSVEGNYKHRCTEGHEHPFALTAVALLGVTPPGVKTLRSVQDLPDWLAVAAAQSPPDGATPVQATILAAPESDGSDATPDVDRVELQVPNVVLPVAAASDGKLRDYWLHGEGAAKIRWGTEGDFTRCVRQLSRYVRDPEGLCAEYHHAANGFWPGDRRNRDKVSASVTVSDGDTDLDLDGGVAEHVARAVADLPAGGTVTASGVRVTAHAGGLVTVEDEDDEITIPAADLLTQLAPHVAAKFDPRQPRDQDGKWTDGAGGGSASKYPGMSPATPETRAAVRSRIGKAIPPAWTDVHIADNLDTASLLVRGRDGKGRMQSIYSAQHTANAAAAKFARVRELAKHLDKLDSAIERDAVDNDSAAALMLIRRLGMRPGSDRDTRASTQAHGATNLRARHVTVDGDTARFDFTGKKGVHIRLSTDDPQVVDMLRGRLEGKGPDDRLFDTDEQKTRAYMRGDGGVPDGFLLKDLRTVHANVVALREIAARGGEGPQTKAEFRRWRRQVAEAVSAALGNTPTLALNSYINPTVFSPWVRDESWL